MPILVRQKGKRWQQANDVEFVDEAQLQQMLYEGPELVSPPEGQTAVFIKEADLPGSGSTDLLGVDANGNIFIVETKLARNPEVRRKVIGQILEYAAYLWRKSYEEFDNLFLKREGKSITDLLGLKTPEGLPEDFQENVSNNLQSGTFNLFIAVDHMNDELEKIIAYVSSRGTGLKLQVLELCTYKMGDLEILAPQRHGESVPPPPLQPVITIEKALANCPDDHSRLLFKVAVDTWHELGHEIRPGTVGVAFRADVTGTKQSIFWASRGDLQGALSVMEKNAAPAEALKAYRATISRIRGFNADKFLNEAQPITKFANLSEAEVRSFVSESDKLVHMWREAAKSSDIQSSSAD
jgi:hypothetical protein